MTKKPVKRADKPARKPRKRGPKEQRLIITEDPEVALAMLLRPKKRR